MKVELETVRTFHKLNYFGNNINHFIRYAVFYVGTWNIISLQWSAWCVGFRW